MRYLVTIDRNVWDIHNLVAIDRMLLDMDYLAAIGQMFSEVHSLLSLDQLIFSHMDFHLMVLETKELHLMMS
jgi:hypothetical protein